MKSDSRLHTFILYPSSFILSVFPFLFNLCQQLVHTLTLFFDAVAYKVDFGSAVQVEGETQLFPNVGSSMAQRGECCLIFLFCSGDGEKDPQTLQIVSQPHIRDRYWCQAWIFQLITNNLDNLLTQEVRNSFRPPHPN